MSFFKRIIPCIILACAVPAGAETNTAALIDRLNADSFKERESARRELVGSITGADDPALGLVLAARDSEHPEIAEQSSLCLRDLFERHELGVGRADLGVKWIYWIAIKDGRPTYLPFAREIRKDSPLIKSGLKELDLILAVNGEEIRGKGCIAALEKRIAEAPAGSPLVVRVNRQTNEGLVMLRKKPVEIKLSPSTFPKTGARKELPGEYAKWLSGLEKLHLPTTD